MPTLITDSIVGRYNRDSVERALTLHFGPEHVGTFAGSGWLRTAHGGYVIGTRRGIVELRTLREAAIMCHGAAHAKGNADEARECANPLPHFHPYEAGCTKGA